MTGHLAGRVAADGPLPVLGCGSHGGCLWRVILSRGLYLDLGVGESKRSGMEPAEFDWTWVRWVLAEEVTKELLGDLSAGGGGRCQ